MATTNPKQPKPLSVSDAMLKRHADMAADAFKDHVVTERLNQGMFRSWRCARPNSGTYGFTVNTTPGYMFVTGDIGELMLCRTEDMVDWSRKSIGDPSYFAEKVPPSIPTVEWSFDRAMEWCKDRIKDANDYYGDEEEASESVAKLKALMDEAHTDGINGEMDEHEFSMALYETNLCDGCDWPNFKVFNSNFCWCREAVKWLLEHLPEAQK